MDPTIRRHEDDPVTDRRREPGYDLPGERRPDTGWEPDDTDRLRDPRPGDGTAIDNEEGGTEALGAGAGALGGAAVGMGVGGPPGAVVGGAVGAGAGAGLGDQAEEEVEESDGRDR